jgi:hypothetical protein
MQEMQRDISNGMATSSLTLTAAPIPDVTFPAVAIEDNLYISKIGNLKPESNVRDHLQFLAALFTPIPQKTDPPSPSRGKKCKRKNEPNRHQ